MSTEAKQWLVAHKFTVKNYSAARDMDGDEITVSVDGEATLAVYANCTDTLQNYEKLAKNLTEAISIVKEYNKLYSRG